MKCIHISTTYLQHSTQKCICCKKSIFLGITNLFALRNPLCSNRSTSSTITNCSCISNYGKSSLISRRETERARNQQSTTATLDAGSTLMNYIAAQRLKCHSYWTTLPPIFGKLIKRIEQKNFIEMAELLPESLRHIATDDDQPVVSKPKR